MTDTGSTLPASLDALVEVGARAGLDADAVREEGLRLAAGVVGTSGPSTVHVAIVAESQGGLAVVADAQAYPGGGTGQADADGPGAGVLPVPPPVA